MASLSFDAQSVAPQATYTPIPAGVYTTAIVDSDVKPTRSGDGTQAVFTLQVVDGPFAGRKVFARINVRNPSAEAERIGQGQLSALCHAAGVLQLQDTSQLHGKVVRAKVTVRPASGNYDASNDVKSFEAVGGASTAAPAAGMPAAAPAAPAGAAVPPWAKKSTA